PRAPSFAGLSSPPATSSPLPKNAALAPGGEEGAAMGGPTARGAGVLASAPATLGRRRRLLSLEPGRNRLRLGPPLAPRRLLLLLSLGLRLDAGLGGVRHTLTFLGRLAQRHPAARLPDHIRARRRVQRH